MNFEVEIFVVNVPGYGPHGDFKGFNGDQEVDW